MDVSGKTYSKCRKAIKRGQEKAATEGCGFLLLSDIVHSYFFLLLLLLLSVILALFFIVVDDVVVAVVGQPFANDQPDGTALCK